MNFKPAALSLTLLLALVSLAAAQTRQPGAPTDAVACKSDEREREIAEREGRIKKLLAEKWQVRVNVLMVSVRQGVGLELLPSLRDHAQIDAACTRLMQMIARKEARLIA